MKTLFLLNVAAAAGVIAAGASMSASSPVPNAAWNANGATACEKFLTTDVMSTVLLKPSGRPSKDSARSCHRGSISIALSSGSVEALTQRIEHVPMATALAGVGDAAYWTTAGAVSAVKAPDRQCDISVAAPEELRVKDEALGQALGAVCNQLFALK